MTDQEKKELGIRAVEVFPDLFPDALVHDSYEVSRGVHGDNAIFCCRKCKKSVHRPDIYAPCTVPDPIDINWDNAMRLFREATGHLNIRQIVLLLQGLGYPNLWNFLRHATPADYIEAACEAKEKE